MTNSIKFLYSYGGKIIPRRSDGKLRYIGGFTRVLSVDRSISFADLMVKFGESCGSSMNLKCKLPSEDLDVLISIKCDEDLKNVIQEYDRVSNQDTKIKAVLFPLNSAKRISPPSSPMSCFDFPVSKVKSKPEKGGCFYSPPAYVTSQLKPGKADYFYSPPSYAAAARRCYSPAMGYPVDGGKIHYTCCERGSPRHLYYVAHRNHTQ